MKINKRILIAGLCLITSLLLVATYNGFLNIFGDNVVLGWIDIAEESDVVMLKLPQILLVIFLFLCGVVSICGKKWAYLLVIVSGLVMLVFELFLKAKRGYVMDESLLTFFISCALELIYSAIGLYAFSKVKKSSVITEWRKPSPTN